MCISYTVRRSYYLKLLYMYLTHDMSAAYKFKQCKAVIVTRDIAY